MCNGNGSPGGTRGATGRPANSRGGTLAGVVASRCFTEGTARRAIDLTEAIFEGGDDYRLDESE